MSADFLARVRSLSTLPSPEHPFGLRHAVIERACIMHFDGKLPVHEADELAWALLVDGGQTTLGGVR